MGRAPPRRLKPLRTRLARGLVRRGVLSEERSRLLGVVPATRFPAADEGPERELRARLHEVLVGGRAPAEEEALLLGLLEPLGLVDRLVPREHRRAARARAKDVAEAGLAGAAVRDAVREVQVAVMLAIIVAVTAPTTTG